MEGICFVMNAKYLEFQENETYIMQKFSIHIIEYVEINK